MSYPDTLWYRMRVVSAGMLAILKDRRLLIYLLTLLIFMHCSSSPDTARDVQVYPLEKMNWNGLRNRFSIPRCLLAYLTRQTGIEKNILRITSKFKAIYRSSNKLLSQIKNQLFW